MGIYRRQVVERLRKSLELAEAGKDVNHTLDLARPQQYLRDYDRAISMLDMTKDQEITLDQTTFSQLVLDEWEWRGAYEATTNSYLSNSVVGATR